MKTFAIVGAGAIGCYYGGRLVESGNDVRFLMRADYEEVKSNGLKLESVDGNVHLKGIPCAKTAEEIGPVDVVIVAWKTTSNSHLKEVISPMLHDETLILTLQNGLGNVELLSELFGKERVLGALCFICSNRISSGHIRHTAGGTVAVGELVQGISPRLEELVAIMNAAQFECRAVDNLLETQWRKLVWNVPFNGLCITEGGIDTQELLSRPGGEERVRELMGEVIKAARGLGLEIEEKFIEAQVSRTRPMGPYRPSSMIDYVEGREIEIEAIWGEPVRRAEAAGIAVPAMKALYEEILQLSVER